MPDQVEPDRVVLVERLGDRHLGADAVGARGQQRPAHPGERGRVEQAGEAADAADDLGAPGLVDPLAFIRSTARSPASMTTPAAAVRVTVVVRALLRRCLEGCHAIARTSSSYDAQGRLSASVGAASGRARSRRPSGRTRAARRPRSRAGACRAGAPRAGRSGRRRRSRRGTAGRPGRGRLDQALEGDVAERVRADRRADLLDRHARWRSARRDWRSRCRRSTAT